MATLAMDKAYNWECERAYKLRLRFQDAIKNSRAAEPDWSESYKWFGIFKGRHAEYQHHVTDCADCMQGLWPTAESTTHLRSGVL